MLLGSLQENILVVLCYDEARAKIVRGLIEPALFGGPYRTVAARIYDFIDAHKKPPGDHLPDILSDKLEKENGREGQLYADIVENIHAAKDHINPEYVMTTLQVFVKRQAMRVLASDLVKAAARDTEESLEEAEQLLAKANKTTLSVFDPGLRLSDAKRALSFLDLKDEALPTGIPELDKRGYGPTRKELHLYIANTKSGKTHWLIHLAKMALMHRVRVCHISLEMSDERCAQRYLQALFAVSKRNEPLQAIKFKRDTLGRLIGFDDLRITPKLSLTDPNIRKKLERLIDKWSVRLLDNIIIKPFPTGSLTVRQLEAYLDNLEATERFVPDLLIIDYPDLMRLDKDNYRLALDQVYKDIRGLLVTRNIAGAVVSQSHRGAAKSKLVDASNVAEAYSKIAHADTVITYTQTLQERKLGLARLHVAGGRNDEDKLTIVIAQQYGIGGFALDSAIMVNDYWKLVPEDEDGT